MSEFWIYFEKGFRHILNPNIYDHILFLMALSIPYLFKDWKKPLLLITIFTVAHSLSVMLSVYEVVIIKQNLVAFLIPFSILILALFHLFTSGKSSKNESMNVVIFITLFFGIIHGLGFAGYFNAITGSTSQFKILSLLEFGLGLEIAQIIVVMVVLMVSYSVQNFFRFSKKDWTLVLSSFVIGVVLPMIIESKIWIR